MGRCFVMLENNDRFSPLIELLQAVKEKHDGAPLWGRIGESKVQGLLLQNARSVHSSRYRWDRAKQLNQDISAMTGVTLVERVGSSLYRGVDYEVKTTPLWFVIEVNV